MFLRAAVGLILGAALLANLFGTAVATTPTPVLPTSTPDGYRGQSGAESYRGAFADLAVEIDNYWYDQFASAGAAYHSPGMVSVETPTQSACGLIEPVPNAFYCTGDRTIYLIPGFLESQHREFGDYAAIVVLAHEWGHHVQELLGVRKPAQIDHEWQAECLMGAFTAHADDLGLLDYGDFLEAWETAREAGRRGGHTHPNEEDRVKALTKGYGGGPVDGCDLPLNSGRPDAPGGTDPIIDRGQVGPPHARELLPATPALAHAGCFFLYDEAELDFAETVSRFTDTPDAQSQLSALGWQDGAFRQFGCNGPPPGTAGWIDVSVHVFADESAAQAAVPYFAAARIAGTTLRYADAPLLGDATTAITGPASNGWEYTIYASEGPVLVRVTGVAPAGDPKADVAAVTADVLAGVAASMAAPVMLAPSPTVPPAPTPAASVVDLLPDRLEVANAACFLPFSDWRFTKEEVVPWLGRAGAPAELVDAWRWQDGANRTLRCASPTPGGASQFDVAIHQFGDAVAARAAETYLQRGYETGPEEARRCGTVGEVVVCVTGRGVGAPPTGDVEAVLRQVLANA